MKKLRMMVVQLKIIMRMIMVSILIALVFCPGEIQDQLEERILSIRVVDDYTKIQRYSNS